LPKSIVTETKCCGLLVDIVGPDDLVDVAVWCSEMLPSPTVAPLGIRIEELNSRRDEGGARNREGFYGKANDGAAAEELVVLIVLGVDVYLGTVSETKSVACCLGNDRLHSENVAEEGRHSDRVRGSYAEPTDCNDLCARIGRSHGMSIASPDSAQA
jgi:hypothetical protein